MKKVFFATLLAAGCMAAQAQAPQTSADTAKAEIKFAETTHDFGTIEHKGNGTCEFTFTNTGTAPLVVTAVQPSCGCTTPNGYTKEPVAPGASGTISVKYDTNRQGSFNKPITVRSNAKTPTVTIYIKGTVKAPASATPQQ